MQRRRLFTTAVLAACPLLAAACSSASSTTGKTPASASPAAAATLAPAKKFTLDKPVKFVAIISDKGQDAFAVADFNDGARLAVADINAAGGIGGHPVEFQAVTTPPFGDITNAFNQAVSDGPTVILGPVSSTTLLTVAAKADKAGIPVVSDATDANAARSGTAGSQWIFALRPLNTSEAAVAARYAAKELGSKKIGMLYLNAAFGKQGLSGVTGELTKDGAALAQSVPFDSTAKDLTTQVQAVKRSDAVIDWGTPQSLASSVIDFAQQGLSAVPHIGPGSVGFDSFVKGVNDPGALDNVYGVLDCNPNGDPRPATTAWAARYAAAYGYKPSYSSAELYDAVVMTRQIIESAQKADPATIRDGLNALDYTTGICATRYHSVDNILTDQAVVVSLKGAKFTTVKSYDNR